MKRFIIIFTLCSWALLMNAQIGYQVSLLNTATGEPRANERVTAKVEITDSKNNMVFTDNMDGVTNEFGVLSLTIGNSQTFANVNMVNYPFYISVTVGGVLIGKTQMLSVPFANSLVPVNVVGTWRSNDNEVEYVFYDNGIYNYRRQGNLISGEYEVQGKSIYVFMTYTNGDYNEHDLTHLIMHNNTLWKCGGINFYKKVQ